MANEPQMSPIQAAVWAFLKERFAGKENAAPRATILTRFNMVRLSELSDRDFRARYRSS